MYHLITPSDHYTIAFWSHLWENRVFLGGESMQYVLAMMLFSSIAHDEMVDKGGVSIPVEATEYITIRGDSVPVLDPIVIYPIEEFIRIEEDN